MQIVYLIKRMQHRVSEIFGSDTGSGYAKIYNGTLVHWHLRYIGMGRKKGEQVGYTITRV